MARQQMNTLLLTGLPRSGTTLACALLNRVPDVLALSESIILGRVDTREEALKTVAGFLDGVREGALRDGVAPTKTREDGWTTDNFMSAPGEDGGPRSKAAAVRVLPIGKPLSKDFLLCVKQPALFTALAQELMRQHPLAAIIRSPLAVMASWQTVTFPIQQGRMPPAERLDPELGARIAATEDPLERQVELIAWFLSVYSQLPERRVFRYEDFLLAPKSQLRAMLGDKRRVGQAEPHPIIDEAPEHRYPDVDFAELAGRLRRIQPLVERFYPEFDRTLSDAAAGRRISPGYRGADGKGGKVDFFVAGVMKAGSTALAAYLERHPAIRMANRKEVQFFQNERRYLRYPDFERYHAWFRPPVAGASIIGEATPHYIYGPDIPKRIRAYNPDARMIVVLRHPTFRAYSHWRMERAFGMETRSFSEAIRAKDSGRSGPHAERMHRRLAYTGQGLYGSHVRGLLAQFPRSQCHFLRTDSLWLAPEAEVLAIQRFLGLSTLGLGDEPPWESPTLGAPAPPMSAEDRAYLDGLFRDEIVLAQELTGLDLGDWLQPDYAEPMRQDPVAARAEARGTAAA